MKEQKVALVTGGMGGLGTALCRRLHAAGFAVVAAHTPGNARVASWLDEQQAQQYYFHPLAIDVSLGYGVEYYVQGGVISLRVDCEVQDNWKTLLAGRCKSRTTMPDPLWQCDSLATMKGQKVTLIVCQIN